MPQIVMAPLTGKLVPLEQVPDPVFAEKMLGDGIAILPEEGLVVAPIGGDLVALPASGHACGIVTEDGIELLIHIGIDTVEMDGRGFRALATRGDCVIGGQPLIEFELGAIEAAGKSMLSPVVVAGAEVRLLAKGSVKRGEPLLEIVAQE